MALLSLIFGINRTSIGALQLDALISEETKLENKVTSYAVDSGVEITDHITEVPEQLTLSGVVSGGGVILFMGGGRSKLIQAKATLRQIHRNRLPITIITGSDVYPNYGMVTASISRNNESERLNVEATFKRIITAEVDRADMPEENVDPSPAGDTAGNAVGRAGPTDVRAGEINTDTAPPLTRTTETSWLGRLTS